ncbi:MAG: Nif3-like dinuclear metal center hexameric protein [Flavobacteriales bacterium]
MQLAQIIKFLEQQFPLSLQEDYDNAGLLYGRPEQEITGALVCLDSTEAIVEEAIETGCNLIIAHHPIVFKGLKKINGKTYIERVVERCIQQQIAIYAIHTNLDNHYRGVNQKIAAKLGLINTRILKPMRGQLSKLVVYVPIEDFRKVDHAILGAGAGQIGNYSECHFRSEGIGTFTPLKGAAPVIGKIDQREEVAELKLEYVVSNHLIADVLSAMQQAHPYEEVAYELIALLNQHQELGAGMVGELPEAIESLEFLKKVKDIFNCGCIKHTDLVHRQIKTIALCGGSGSFLLPDAIRAKADLYLSADFKYHEFFDAESKLIIADIGHFESEQFTSEILTEIIKENFPNFAIRLTKLNTNPVNYL